ncbi:hypothetical protein SDC9_180286 [bioreactor metagenome]|uniref:Uncharacterized protein n=1 Tax=bioreactor metagenome TaxID=1076179 RepID=A0A645H2U2_9ZZZZ
MAVDASQFFIDILDCQLRAFKSHLPGVGYVSAQGKGTADHNGFFGGRLIACAVFVTGRRGASRTAARENQSQYEYYRQQT